MEFQQQSLLTKKVLLILAANIFWLSGVFAGEIESTSNTALYLKKLEQLNQISFNNIINTRGAYIPSMCYTKTLDKNQDVVNSCYSCHTAGKVPNFINDSNLQQELFFPPEMLKNPYSNLFKDHSKQISAQTDSDILKYVRKSNYQQNNQILLSQFLPKDWPGYRPDSYFNFDSEGFDRKPNGEYTLWRAFRYYPFLGTFWPTNGSTDDVLIRLAPEFSKDNDGKQDISIYKINLAIVESMVKQKTIQLAEKINEKKYQQDFNKDGKLAFSQTITFPAKKYIGLASSKLAKGQLHLAAGLYPENTEFLHSVRYLDWDETQQRVILSKRMKELRYSKKYQWKTYSELETDANLEFWDAQTSLHDEPPLTLFRGNARTGMHATNGWIFQGFIEDKVGDLRPQTREESLYCMGCHSGIGATTDATFAMPRKLEGQKYKFGWQHWSQIGLQNITEPKTSYKNNRDVFEYSFYLMNNHSASEFDSNDEVRNKFFLDDGSINKSAFKRLSQDISFLLLPSKKRALKLNKSYRAIVQQQSFIYGREGNSIKGQNLYKKVKPNQKTDIVNIISK